jgi:hypothetical protein
LRQGGPPPLPHNDRLMTTRSRAAIAVLLVCLAAGLPAQTRTFPVDDLKPGMVATGRTVFEGERLDEFKAHILGVLHNVIGPRRNLILARLEGGPLANTGVIAGMSGSPVYIDGRLVGAVSYSLGQFSKEPIAGITPFDEMVEAATLPTPRRQAARVELRRPSRRTGCAPHCRRRLRGPGRLPRARTTCRFWAAWREEIVL